MMSKHWVVTLTLVTMTALMGSSIVQARKLRLMPPDCPTDGRHYNALLKKAWAMEKRLDALEKKDPKLAAQLRGFIIEKRANLRRQRAILLQIKQLEKEIKALLAQIRKIKASKLDPDAKRAAIKALRAKIKAKRLKIKQLRAELTTLRAKLRKGAPPGSSDEAAMKYLGKKMDGLTKAIQVLALEWKKGLKAPEVIKAIKALMMAVKHNDASLTALTISLDRLNRRLDKGIKIQKHDGPKPIWAGWKFKISLSGGPILLNGKDFISVYTLANFEAEHVWRNHLGVIFGLSLGGVVTQAQSVDGSMHRVYPFVALGRIGAVARWKYWGLQLDAEAGWLQNPVVDSMGYLTVHGNLGLEVRPHKHFFVFGKLGVSYYLKHEDTTGLRTIFGLGAIF